MSAPAKGSKTPARHLGALVQGIILGLLVSVAVIELIAISDDVRLFRYQAF